MTMKYWAKRGKTTLGPFDTMETALNTYRETYPHNGPDYMASAKRNQILTGYGEFGPHFDMRWHDAKERSQ